jgi:hypothetical protein
MIMKIIKYFSLVLAMTLSVSCVKNTIEYNSRDIVDKAEFQLHYINPVTSVAANNITKVEINGELFSNDKAPLTTYNAIPSGAVGRFYAIDPGSVNIKMYTGTDMATLVYDQNTTLTAGKQNVFVHDFTKVPVVFNNGYPYAPVITEKTDSSAWVKFYNFLYETTGVPYDKKIQYQYLDSRTNLPVNIGPPVAFGETTDWQKITVVKSVAISSGSRLITFKMKEVDANGVIIGDLSIRGTSGTTYTAYSATATLAIGRRYHMIYAGFRTQTTPNSSVRTFTAL